MEPAEASIMHRQPRPKNEPVLTLTNSIIILLQSCIMTGISLTVFILEVKYNYFGAETILQEQSLCFAVLTAVQLTQSFLSKSPTQSVFQTGITSNKYLIGAFLVSFGFLVLGIHLPGLNTWLEIEAIPPIGWAVIGVCMVTHFILVEFMKLIVRQFTQKPATPGYTIVQLNSQADELNKIS